MRGYLKGSAMFMSDLIKQLIPVINRFHGCSWIITGTGQLNEVQIIKDLGSIDKDILIIEKNILETGTTLKSITELLQSRKVNSLEIVTLLDKPNRRKTGH